MIEMKNQKTKMSGTTIETSNYEKLVFSNVINSRIPEISRKILKAFNLAENLKDSKYRCLPVFRSSVDSITNEDVTKFYNYNDHWKIMEKLRFLSFLISLGLDIKKSNFHLIAGLMAQCASVEVVSIHLDNGADVNEIYRFEINLCEYVTVLTNLFHYSAKDQKRFVELFMKHGLKRETVEKSCFYEHRQTEGREFVKGLLSSKFPVVSPLDIVGKKIFDQELERIRESIGVFHGLPSYKKEEIWNKEKTYDDKYHLFITYSLNEKTVDKNALMELLNRYNAISSKYKLSYNTTSVFVTIEVSKVE